MQKQSSAGEKLIHTVIILLMCISTAIVIPTVFSVYFSSNDDITLLQIMSGTYTGSPADHLIYVMYPLGMIFKALYSLSGKVPWYEGFTVLAPVVCILLSTVRFSQILRFNKEEDEEENRGNLLFSSAGIIVFFLFLFAISFKYMVESQYTVTAGFLAGCALFYLATSGICRTTSEKVFQRVTVLLLLTVSLWLRKEVCLMALPVYAWILILNVFNGCKKNGVKEAVSRAFYEEGLYVIIAVIVIVLSFLANRAAYRSEEWQSYLDFNEARTDVYDYGLMPLYQDNKEFYDSLGIDEDAYTALIEYSINLVGEADTETFRTMSEKQKAINKEWQQYYNVPVKIAKDTYLSLKNNFSLLTGKVAAAVFLLGIVLSVIRIVKKKNPWALVMILGLAFYALVFTAYFTYRGRLPERVFVPLDVLCIMGTAGVLGSMIPETKKSGAAGAVLCGLIAGFVLILAGFSVVGTAAGHKEMMKKAEPFKELNDYIAGYPDDVFLVTAKVYSVECRPLFDKNYRDLINNVKMVDWCYKSPLADEKFEALEIADTPDILTEEGVYLVTSEYIPVEFYCRMAKRNLAGDKEVRAERIYRQSGPAGDIIIWKLYTVR